MILLYHTTSGSRLDAILIGMQKATYGIVEHPDSSRPTDYLFRVSIKNIIRNDAGEVLVIKEAGRDWWDLPGGGMDHGESVYDGIARELAEEISLQGGFTYRILTVENPNLLPHGFYQIRLIMELTPENKTFAPGIDADEITFINPATLKDSHNPQEQNVYKYSQLTEPSHHQQ